MIRLGTRRMASLALGLTVAVTLSACSSSGYHYVKNSDDKTYFKVPDDWKGYDEDALLKSLEASARVKANLRENGWQVAFDASPHPSLQHIGDPISKHPTVLATVEALGDAEADSLSTQAMRNFFFEIDTALDNNAGEVTQYEPLELEGGFRGHRLVGFFDTDSNKVAAIDQTIIVDQATSRIFALLVTCSAACYEKNEDQIKQIVKSWTVRD